MQTTSSIEKAKTIKDMSVSVPKNIYSAKIPNVDCDTNNFASEPENSLISEMLNQQHPLINTWLVLSSVSICFLSALLFIMR